MRIFVSSSFEDLQEHRAAAIRVLRQLGHEVIAMEDMVAGATTPLTKVLELVDRCEAYVGLFAWRYGFVPGRDDAGMPGPPRGRKGSSATRAGRSDGPKPSVKGAVYGETSITHYEYLRAKEREVQILAFLLDENHPLPPDFVDGFNLTRPGAPADATSIRALRHELQLEKVISWFSTPSDLEARVAASVTSVGLSRQINVQQALSVGGGAGNPDVPSSEDLSVATAIGGANPGQRVLRIDLADTWWSTRLFLIAALAEELTQVRRILLVRRTALPPTRPKSTPPAVFIGQLSTAAIVSTIGAMLPPLRRFQKWMHNQPDPRRDVAATSDHYLNVGWPRAFGSPDNEVHEAERKIKIDVTPELLQLWFGDALLRQPVELADLERASVVDLMRLIDYPNDFVPVLCDRLPDADEPTGNIDVIDKSALTSRLALSYLNELKERARIV